MSLQGRKNADIIRMISLHDIVLRCKSVAAGDREGNKASAALVHTFGSRACMPFGLLARWRQPNVD
jgi:hypothetical protein